MFAGEFVQVTRNGDFAHLIFDAKGASINKLDYQTLEEFEEALGVLSQEKAIKGLAVLSAKTTFIVGADIREFHALFNGEWQAMVQRLEWTNQIFRRLELLSIPTVAVINGAAMGGGFEVALACDMRIMSNKAIVGLPEVSLGLHPGFGGSVRLPRVIPTQSAIDWMIKGKPKNAKSALFDGAIDAVSEAPDTLIEMAHDYLHRALKGELDIENRRNEKSGAIKDDVDVITPVLQNYRTSLSKKPDANAAAMTLLSVLEESLWVDYANAIQLEYESFCRLGQTPESRALVGVFENEQYVKKIAKKRAAKGRSINKIGVVGAGIMGGGITAQSALSGIDVSLVDTDPQTLEKAIITLKELWEKVITKRSLKVTSDDLAKHVFINGALDDADLVIEAVTENAEAKIAVLNRINELTGNEAILASNTSTLSISAMATMINHGENFIGMHFFNPVLQMPLVEVVQGGSSKPEVIDTIFGLTARMSKTPILVQDCVGFFVNRVLFPYFSGFNQLVFAGADIAKIDAVMEEFGWPMGPAKLLDVIGMDTANFADEVLAYAYPERMAHHSVTVMDALFHAGRLGVKSGMGFYDYEAGKRKLQSDPNEAVASFRSERREFGDEEIIDRMMLPMCIEVARCLEEGVVASPAEADVAVLLGLGFPRYRGGIARYMDEVGMKTIIGRAESYAELGARYHPTVLMREMAANNRTYY